MRIALILTALVLACSAARAGDALCDQPPYGATRADYAAAQPALEDIAKAIAANPGQSFGSLALLFVKRGPDWYMKHVVLLGPRKACYAKFDDSVVAQQDFINAGIDAKQLATLPTTILAIRYFHSMGYPPNPETDVLCSRFSPADTGLWSTRADCEQRAAARDRERARAYQLQQEQLKELREREQQQHPGIVLIYAPFFCMEVPGYETSCKPILDFGTQMETFATLAECQEAAGRQTGQVAPRPINGHYPAGNNMWYECRSKRVDAWEPVP